MSTVKNFPTNGWRRFHVKQFAIRSYFARYRQAGSACDASRIGDLAFALDDARARSVATLIAVGCGGEKTPVVTPPAVTVAKPVMQNVNDYLDFSGNTVAVDSVTLVARVEGYLDQVPFRRWLAVKKDALLFTIQQAQYKAELQQADRASGRSEGRTMACPARVRAIQRLLKQDAATQTEVDHWQFEKGIGGGGPE